MDYFFRAGFQLGFIPRAPLSTWCNLTPDIGDEIHYKVWDEITCVFKNSKAVEV